MDLEVARKALSKRGAFSSKRVAFFGVAGLSLVVGILLRSGQYFGQPEVEQNAPVTVAAPPPSPWAATPAVETQSLPKIPPPAQESANAPNEQAEQTGEVVEQAEQAEEAVEHAEQPEAPGSGMLLVSRQPIAPTMYGFPAGRPFRVIGHDGGYAHIQDLKSSASGWIDEAALAPPPSDEAALAPPPSVPAVSAPSQPKPVAVSRKSAKPSADPNPKATKKDSQVTADSEAATEPDSVQNRPGLFNRGGLFGGIFGNSN
jgi:hypothetical protein